MELPIRHPENCSWTLCSGHPRAQAARVREADRQTGCVLRVAFRILLNCHLFGPACQGVRGFAQPRRPKNPLSALSAASVRLPEPRLPELLRRIAPSCREAFAVGGLQGAHHAGAGHARLALDVVQRKFRARVVLEANIDCVGRLLRCPVLGLALGHGEVSCQSAAKGHAQEHMHKRAQFSCRTRQAAAAGAHPLHIDNRAEARQVILQRTRIPLSSAPRQ